MKIDLEKGINIQIKGELGQYETLPIENLIKIATSLQDLLYSIAKVNLAEDKPIDLNAFKIELAGFEKGSSVPNFVYSHRPEYRSSFNNVENRSIVTTKLEDLFEISNSGDYYKLLDLYPEPIKRTEIANNLYTFAQGFGRSPVNIVDKVDGLFTPIYKINKFKSAVRDAIVVQLPVCEEEIQTDSAIASIRITRTGKRQNKKIMNVYPQDKFSIEYAPSIIVSGDNRYVLKYPLRCLFEKENDYYVIHSEVLDLIATGETQEEAMKAFGDEFSYLFELLNKLSESQLTRHNSLIKSNINQIVKEVEQ